MTSEHRHYARIDDDGAEGAGAGEGAKGVEAAVGRAEEEAGAGAEEDGSSDPLARALRVLGNTIMGSSRFQ